MNRTIALLIVFALCGLFAAADSLAQVFAQPATPAAPPPAGAPPAVAPRPVGSLESPAAAGAGPARVGFAQGTATLAAPAPAGGGGFIRAVGPGGAGNIVYQAGPGWNEIGGFSLGHGQDDPEMAKLVQTEHELARQSDDLVRQYSETEDYSQREKLRGQLRELLAKQFEAQQQRRERELSNVEQRLGKLREQLKKRTSARDTIVDRRLENLTSDADGLGWTPPAGAGGFSFAPGVGGTLGGQPRPRPAVAR